MDTEPQISIPEKLVLNDTVVYVSEDNDIAKIKLTLIPDGTFDFYMNIYQESKSDTESKSNIVNSNGTWSGNKKTLILTHEEERTAELIYSSDTLNIAGINCYKSDK